MGAWIGPTVLYGCQNAKFCYAIEPDPVAFRQLKNNVDLNPSLISRISFSNSCVIGSTDRSYLMFEGRLLKSGTSEELASDDQVRKLYLGKHFKLKRKL